MTTVGRSRGAAIDIGEVAAPPFVRLPVPQAFFAAIAEAQHAVQSGLEPPAPSSSAAAAHALEHGMPPLNRYTWTPDRDFRAITARLAAAMAGSAMPATAEASRHLVATADDRLLDRWTTD